MRKAGIPASKVGLIVPQHVAKARFCTHADGDVLAIICCGANARAPVGRMLCCAGLLFSACMGIAPAQAATLTPTQGVAIFAPSLRAALIDRDKTLATPRSAMVGQSVNSCDSYLQARRAGATPLEDVNVQLLMAEYILCEALDLLSAPLRLGKHHDHVCFD